jgi:hypothetical protein
MMPYATAETSFFDKIDSTIEYLYVTTNIETILSLLGFTTSTTKRMDGVLAKKAYIEELLGCNFEDFCKLVPEVTVDIENTHKKTIPGVYFIPKIGIGGHIFDMEVFKQHTDIDINLFISMLKKVNHSIFISKNSNGIFQFNNNTWNYCRYTKPTIDDMRESTIDKAIAYTIDIVKMQQNKVEIKSYNILKEGLTIKIEENEKFN